MSVNGCHIPVTLIVVFLLTIRSVVSSSSNDSASHVVSISSESHFNEVLKLNPYTFVKFFSPLCPHCQHMATAFKTLSTHLETYNTNTSTPRNHTVICAEVDLTKKVNWPLGDRFHINGVPILLLFHGYGNGSSVEEYSGLPTTTAMYNFIVNAIALADAPHMPHFQKVSDIAEFTRIIGKRPLVLSVFHDGCRPTRFYPPRMALPVDEWNQVSASFHLDPSNKFATVSDPSLLVPPFCKTHFQKVAAAYVVAPIASVFATNNTACDTARWFFPGVQDGESLSSFIHTSIVPPGSYAVMTPRNARHIFYSDRPLILVFGETETPSGRSEYQIESLAHFTRNSTFLPVYGRAAAFPDMIEHLREAVGGFNNSSRDGVDDDMEVFAYRTTNRGPVASKLKAKNSLEAWGRLQASVTNTTAAETKAGSVTQLTSARWTALFEQDGRNVLLLLHEGANRQLYKFMSRVARLLRPHAGSLVVASFDQANAARPNWPNLKVVSHVPALVFIAPGQSPVVYEGWWTSRGIARFARDYGAPPTQLGDGLLWSDVALAYAFLLGIATTGYGIVLLGKKKRRRDNANETTNEKQTLTRVKSV